MTLREVADPTVHQFRGAAAGAGREVGLFDQTNPVAAARCVQRDAGARDPTANRQHVHAPLEEVELFLAGNPHAAADVIPAPAFPPSRGCAPPLASTPGKPPRAGPRTTAVRRPGPRASWRAGHRGFARIQSPDPPCT